MERSYGLSEGNVDRYRFNLSRRSEGDLFNCSYFDARLRELPRQSREELDGNFDMDAVDRELEDTDETRD
jgi:hypothetical protein